MYKLKSSTEGTFLHFPNQDLSYTAPRDLKYPMFSPRACTLYAQSICFTLGPACGGIWVCLTAFYLEACGSIWFYLTPGPAFYMEACAVFGFV